MKSHVTIQEIAKVLGRSVSTVRRRVSNGLIPVIQEGGKGTELRFDLDEVLLAVKKSGPRKQEPQKPLTKTKNTTPPGPRARWKRT